MALDRRDKKAPIVLPICRFCGAVARHQSWQCSQNPKNICSFCGGTNHTSLMCSQKPRRPLKQEADKTRKQRQEVSHLWYELNPPSPKGTWECYLQIVPDCPKVLTRSTITLEHMLSKVRHPDRKYDVTNLAPSCAACNKEKGSRDYVDGRLV